MTATAPVMKDLHENSTKSYEEQKVNGRSRTFRRSIYDLLAASAKPMTDRQIMVALSESDVNNIRPEITRGKQDGLLLEVDKVKCASTGKTVRRTKVNSLVYFDHPSKKDNE